MGRRVRVSRPQGDGTPAQVRRVVRDQEWGPLAERTSAQGNQEGSEWGSWEVGVNSIPELASRADPHGLPRTRAPIRGGHTPRDSVVALEEIFVPQDFPYSVGRFHTLFKLFVVATWPLIALAWLVQLPQHIERQVIVLMEMLLIVGVLVAAMWVWTIKPRLTRHRVDDEGVHLHQGYAIDLRIPWSAIESARHTDERGRRLGVFVRGGTLYVSGERSNRVLLRLDPDADLHFKGKSFEEVVVDVLEPDRFIRCIELGRAEPLLIPPMEKSVPTEKER